MEYNCTFIDEASMMPRKLAEKLGYITKYYMMPVEYFQKTKLYKRLQKHKNYRKMKRNRYQDLRGFKRNLRKANLGAVKYVQQKAGIVKVQGKSFHELLGYK